MILKNSKDLKTLQNALKPHTKRAYFVGGAVRDYYLQQEVQDIDIEVYDISVEKFDELMQALGAQGVGKSFFVYKLKHFDLSLPRTESKIGAGHRGFRVAITNDTKEAASRRDFTMNALMVNIFDNTLIDHFNGRNDLERGCLKHIDDTAFVEDSLRVLRAIAFVSRFGFSIDGKTLALCQTISLDDLSKERIFKEFDKIFSGRYQDRALEYMFALDIFEKIFSISLNSAQREKLKNYLADSDGYYNLLYYLREVSGVDIETILKSLQPPKSFFTFFKTQPAIDDVVSIKDLLELALKIPLGQWIGLRWSQFENRAHAIGLYEEKFQPTVQGKDLLLEGFCGRELGKELRRREQKEIEELYARKMGTTD